MNESIDGLFGIQNDDFVEELLDKWVLSTVSLEDDETIVDVDKDVDVDKIRKEDNWIDCLIHPIAFTIWYLLIE